VLHRRLIIEGVKAARAESLAGPPPMPSGMPLDAATTAVIQARARLEATGRRRAAPARRGAASA
jgi:hypothetical protein